MNLRGTSLVAGVRTELRTRIQGLVVKGFFCGGPTAQTGSLVERRWGVGWGPGQRHHCLRMWGPE